MLAKYAMIKSFYDKNMYNWFNIQRDSPRIN